MDVLVVDMEMAAFDGGRYKEGVKMAGVVTVTDELYSGCWKPMFDSEHSR